MMRPICLAAPLLALLVACGGGKNEGESAAAVSGPGISVTGELLSARARFFGPPAIPDVWNYTIAFMAPDGLVVAANTPILKFDTQELENLLRDKRNQLNEKQKELERTRILARELVAESRLQVEEAQAVLDKARLKADIPEALLASRDYRENQLLLRQAELTLALRIKELAGEERIQATEVDILERETRVLQLDVDKYEASISSMTILAPGEGVVIHATDRRNNKVAVGDNVWMGRRVMEFPDLAKLEAHLEIPERDSARVRLGDRVEFTLDAAPDKVFSGAIVELASVVRTRSETQPDKVFDAKVRLDEPDPSLMRPGMGINARILAAREAGA